MRGEPHTTSLGEPQDAAAATSLVILLTTIIGMTVSLILLSIWLPGLSASLSGPEPKAAWYLSRTSALAAYILLWLATALGVSMTSALARVWPGGPTVFELHQHTGLLGLMFALFHALILTGDRYIGYSLSQVFIPFASDYRPLWVGLGQVGLYLLGIVTLSFYARQAIGQRLWRLLHSMSFGAFMLALVHGLASGTDSPATWVRALYWVSGGSILFLSSYRLLISRWVRG